MKRAWQFILHYLSANTRHGTHSPYVYQLLEECLYRKLPIDSDVVAYYKELKKSHEALTGHDFGKGITQTTRVSDLAKKSASNHFEANMLAKLCRYHRVNRVLELGSNIGKATAYMASACPEAMIDSVDGNQALTSFAQSGFTRLNLRNARPIKDSFQSFFDTNKECYDLIFIDGDHYFEPTIENYRASKRILRGEGPIVLHDIYWSSGMNEAWEEIKRDEEATVTIDLFFFGLVYFRQHQKKQHFKLRYPQSMRDLFL